MSALRSAVWSAVGFVCVYLVAIRTGAGQRLDESAMIWLAATVTSQGWAQVLLHLVSEVSVLLVAAFLVLGAALLRGGRVALSSALTVGTVIIAAQVLKATLTRPPLLDLAIANSFPSGHVAAVAGLAAALVVALPKRARALVVGVLVPVVGLTGLATVVLEWHRPSDVVGSVLLALTVASLAVALTERRTPPSGAAPTSASDRYPAPGSSSAASIYARAGKAPGEPAPTAPVRSARR